jgi:hypothetical protein
MWRWLRTRRRLSKSCREGSLSSKHMFVLGLLDLLNSREQAALFWIGVGACLAFWKVPAIGPQLIAVTRSFFVPKLLLSVWIPATVYVVGIVYVAQSLGLWHATSLRETLYWYVGAALVLAGSATQASDLGKFKKLFGRVFKVTIAIEFLVNLYVFPLAVELIVIPLAVLLAGMQVVAERDPTLAPARRVITFVLASLGVVTLAFAFTSAARDLDGLLTWMHFEQFVVPLALTVAFAPFLYFVALWSTYEQVFIRLDIYGQDKNGARRAKWAMIRVCRLSLRNVGRLSRRFFPMIQSVSPDTGVTVLARTFENELRAAERDERKEAA